MKQLTKYNSRLLNLLSNLPNELFITDTIYPSQIDCAKDILKSFTAHIEPNDEDSARNNHVILLAQMQGGKTGACNSLINILEYGDKKIKTYFGIEDYYFITGMNDAGLHKQTYDRCLEEITFMSDIKNNYPNKPEKIDVHLYKKYRQSEFNKGITNVFVYKNSDLRKFSKTETNKIENCVIFIDESHYGSGENHILTEWLGSNGIDWKNNDELKKRNIYIISVSATPLDEIISDLAETKEKIILKTTDNYVGVSDFLDLNLIFRAENSDFIYDKKNKTYKVIEYIKEAYTRIENNKGVIFVRCLDKKEEVIKNDEFIKCNFNCIEINSKNGKIDYTKINEPFNTLYYSTNDNLLNKKHNQPIIYFIKGAFRAGHTIDKVIKDYTYLVYDFAKECETTLQGLFGRMCGYRDDKKSLYRTKFYVNNNHINEYYEWVDNNFQNDSTPTGKNKFIEIEHDEKLTEDTFYKITYKPITNRAIKLTNENIINLGFINKLEGKQRIEAIKLFIKTELKYTNFQYVGTLQLWKKNGEEYSEGTNEKLLYRFNEEKPYTIGFTLADVKRELGREYKTNIDEIRQEIGLKWIHVVLDERDTTLKIFKSITYIEKRIKNINGRIKTHKVTELEEVLC